MQSTAVRLYGKEDLRMETFELPAHGDDEILARVVSDSICMSSFKAAEQGSEHKRVPADCAEHPVIIGHEFCGELISVGKKWQDKYRAGDKFSIQPAINYKGTLDAPGYSYRWIGGDATYIVIPNEVMENDCLLPYSGEAFFYGSLAEPMSCIVGAFHASYHTKYGSYVHEMGIRENGCMALLAAAGPMGMGAIDYAIHCDRRPRLLVVTDIDSARLARVAGLYTPEEARKNGVELHYVNTAESPEAEAEILALTGGRGFDDVFCFAPVRPVVEMSDRLLANDGCLNFFAGPIDKKFSAELNFYNVHYAATHIVGTSGGNTSDMLESLAMMEKGLLNPAAMVTHVGGLDAVVDTTLRLPKIPGGKKLIYTHISMPLTAIADFERLGAADPMFAKLAELCAAHNGLWNAEAERFLLSVKAVD